MLAAKAESIFHLLSKDPQFQHGGKESRGIVLPTEYVLGELAKLTDSTIDPHARDFLFLAMGLLTNIGDNGIYVRIKGKSDIELRGYAPERPQNPTDAEFYRLARYNINCVRIWPNDNDPYIHIHSPHFELDGVSISKISEFHEDQMSGDTKMAMIKGILEIVDEQINQVIEE